ncbi:hypothetical protein [Varibaculum cambriense]|uniref:hypothetical protein n=1 Tax=Varibaculum cambriense TaxID=184870 RepID=UPI00241F122E|nr:hypothetical protein [Varibaculum cambriense]MBS5963338.1 hypothetical protein [Varibaculum cambriense]
MAMVDPSFKNGQKLTDLAVVSQYALDPVVICRSAGLHRVSELGRGCTRDVSWLFSLPEQSLDQFLATDEGERFLWQLRADLQQALKVWLGGGSREEAERFSRMLGTGNILDTAQYPEGRDYPQRLVGAILTCEQEEDTKIPWMLDPENLVEALIERWEDLSVHSRQRIRHAFLGIDATHLPPKIASGLKTCGIIQTRRSHLTKWLTDPKVLAYLVVIIYSSLRVLPVSLVKEFHGSLLVLWTMDIVTAIPYTWGVLAMFTAKRQSVRIIGTLTTAITFAAPYVYFAMTGKDYPTYVIVIVILFIISGFFVEGSKYLRERYLVNFLQKPQETGTN